MSLPNDDQEITNLFGFLEFLANLREELEDATTQPKSIEDFLWAALVASKTPPDKIHMN